MLPNTDLVVNFVPKTWGYVDLNTALEVFPVFLHYTDRTSLINVCTKGEGLKRLRSREICCQVKCILTGTGGILADFFTSIEAYVTATPAAWFDYFSIFEKLG